MPRKSTIARLPPEQRAFVDKLLREDRLTLDEMIGAITTQFPEAVPSRSALHRHKISVEELTARMRAQDQAARAIVAELGENPDEKAGALLVQAVTTAATGIALRFSETDRTFLGNTGFVVANPRLEISGTFEVTPPTTPGANTSAGIPNTNVIFLPAGLTSARTAAVVGPPATDGITRYNPISRLIKSITGNFWHAGTYRKLLGARANITGLSLAIDDRFKGQMQAISSFEDIDEDDLPTDLDYSNFPVPTVCSDENTVGLIGLVDDDPIHCLMKSLSVDFGNTINPNKFTEKRFNKISKRASTFKLMIARPAKDDFDPFDTWKKGKLITSAFTLTEEDDRYQTLGIRGQIENVNETQGSDNEYLLEVSGRCIPSSAGGDEFYVLFGIPG